MIVILAPIVKLGRACQLHCVHGHNFLSCYTFSAQFGANIIVDGSRDQIMTRYLIKGAGGLSICAKASTAQVGL